MKIYKTILIAIPLIISTNVYASTGMFGATEYKNNDMDVPVVYCNKLPHTPSNAILTSKKPCYLMIPDDSISVSSINAEYTNIHLTAKLKQKKSTLILTAKTDHTPLGDRRWGLHYLYAGRVDMASLPPSTAPIQEKSKVRIKLYCENKWIKSNQGDYTCGNHI